MNNSLVSIVSPCFNGENYIERFLDSVLAQTYANIELIIINDASNDGTFYLLQSYREAFELNEIPYHIINLEQNGGQANAINEGLKIFKGDYITWPDSDDVLSEVSIEEKVNYMENYKVDFIRTDVEVVKEGDIEKCLYKLSDVNDFSNDEIFNDLIFERNVYFCPGGYMVTRKAIINSIPNLHIYPSRFGQNWQILLPISEKYSCHYLDKCHYKYVVREGSHSRINKDDVQKKLRLFDGHKDILINSVSKIRLANKESVLLEIADKYERKKMYLYIEQGFDKLAEKHFTSLKRKQLRDFVFIYLMKTKLYSLVKGIKRKLKVGYEKVH